MTESVDIGQGWVLEAVEATDPDYPGFVITINDEYGVERGSVLVDLTDGVIKARIWKDEDVEHDPSTTVDMVVVGTPDKE